MNITVLITTYNCKPFIAQAVKSILNQSYQNFEILIIDDGSTDATEKEITKITDERIRYVKIEHKGIAAACNIGLKLAKYDWIARFDADDICHPKRFEVQMQYLSGDKYEIISSDCAYFYYRKIRFVTQTNPGTDNIKELLKLHSVISHQSCIYNRKFILEELSGYNEELDSFIDYDLWLRSLNKARFIIIPRVLVFARIRENSVSNSVLYTKNKSIYSLQIKLLKLNTENLQDRIINGWREFFYGDPRLVKKYWFNVELGKWNYRMFLALILSLFPEKIISVFKKKRIRLKLKYLIKSFTVYKYLQTEFDDLLKIVETND